MPLFISPPVAKGPVTVGLSNTLGYPVVYRVTVTNCADKVVSQSPSPLTLLNGQTATSVPASHAPRDVTFTVEGQAAQAASGVRTTVSLTSRQGCAAAKPAPAPLPTAPVAKDAHAGVAIAPVTGGFPVSATIGAVLALCAIGVVLVMMSRRMTGRTKPKPRGEHAGAGKTRGGAHR